jgi:hypothetical protein
MDKPHVAITRGFSLFGFPVFPVFLVLLVLRFV